MNTKKTKLKFGVKKPYKRNTLYRGSFAYIKEQIERKVPDGILSEKTSTHLHLEK